jgi:hypothetical protein
VNLVNLASIVVVVVLRFLLYHYIVFRGVRERPAKHVASAGRDATTDAAGPAESAEPAGRA